MSVDFDRISDSVTRFAGKAKKKAEAWSEEAAIRLRLVEYRRRLEGLYADLGEAMYLRLREQPVDTAEIDRLLGEIDVAADRIATLEAKLANVQENAKAEHGCADNAADVAVMPAEPSAEAKNEEEKTDL